MKSRSEPGAWLIDIEGVLVRDKRYTPVEGSVAWLQAIVDSGRPWCLVSNNSTDRPDELVRKLTAAGFPVTRENLVGALGLATQWLLGRGHRRLMWLGHPRLEDHWRERGFELVEEGSCEAVVLGANPELTVARLDAALAALWEHGADLVSLHRNHFFLDADSRRRLGPGAWAAALEPAVASGRVAVMGKPEEPIYREALKRVGVEPSEALFISDDPVADLVTAKRLGMTTVFTLSGKYDDHRILGSLDQDEWPDIIVATPADTMQAGNTAAEEADT